MLPEKSLAWGRSESCIRALETYGNARKAEIGADNVFDFSIGNPSVPAPRCVDEALKELLTMDSIQLHSYTPAPGLMSFRKALAEDLNHRLGARIAPELIYVTCGAAAGLAACMHGLLLPGEEVIAFAPFFPEYRVYAEGAGGVLVTVPPMEDLQPDLEALERSITEKTKLLLINSPNNPSGVILSKDSLERIAAILREAESRYGSRIYLVSDEPYRDLVYDGTPVPWVPDFYERSIVCNSFSKSLSLPGERIGYLAVSGAMPECRDIFDAIAGAARACGYINPPSLIQRAVERCLGQTADVSVYKKNRDLLYEGLTARGFDCVYPDGAFYLFVKSPEPDARAFSARAKKHELLLVPSDDFGVGGYVRVAYCVSADMIERSMPAFTALAEDYGILP